MLSICVVTQQYQKIVSGIGLYTQNLISWLVKDGHQVTVIAPLDQRVLDNTRVHFIGVPLPLFNHTQARWFFLALYFSRVLRSLKREKFNLIHFTDARESIFYQTDIPTAGNVNDTYAAEVQTPLYYRRYYSDWALRWAYYQFVKYCELQALPRLQAIIANSHYTARVISSKYNIPDKRLYVCYKSIIPGYYATVLRRRQSKPAEPFHILFVGGNMQRKGLPVLIQAAPKILANLPAVEFWVVGKDKAIQRMKALCYEKKVESKFHFFGWIPHNELLNLYAQADVFVMPSLLEAFGVVFLEAMACGIPVIGTRVGGIPELIQDGYNGLLVDPDNPDALAQAIVRVLTDDILWKQLQEAGLKTAYHFDVKRMMQCTYKIYEALLGYPPV